MKPVAGNITSSLRRPGFTLLEVIIALSLTLLLLTAVYGAIRLQYRMTSAGRDQMERAQLSRAILREIENDVRSVVWQVQKPAESSVDAGTTSAVDDNSRTGSSSGGQSANGQSANGQSTSGQSASGQSSSGQSSGGQSSTNQSSTGQFASGQSTTNRSSTSQSSTSGSTNQSSHSQSPDDAFTGGSSGIFGDSQNLVLHISRPSRSLVYASSAEEEADAAERSDLASVSYFMADSSGGGLAAAVAQQNGSDSSAQGGVVGLARLEGDRLSIETAGETNDVESLAASAKVLAREVVAVEFAYWDGLEWLDSSDSVSSGTLPSAIGVTLSIDVESTQADASMQQRSQQTATARNPTEAGEPVQIRYVIAVPLAEPYVSEASF